MSHIIQFGTSGYRGIISQSFTNQHVDAIAFAIAKHLQTQESPSIIIGYDTRLGNDPSCSEGSYTHTLCQRLTYEGIAVSICDSFTSTPAISWAIKHLGYSGGIMLTASHNPASYNGIKFNGPDGAPASLAVTEAISQIASESYLLPLEPIQGHEFTVTHTSITEPFVDHLIELVQNTLNLPIQDCKDQSIVVDSRFGTATDVWRQLQSKLSLSNLDIIHSIPDSDFGLMSPNPSSDTQAITDCIHSCQACIGVGHDPDADRHVIFDENGQHVRPELLCALFTDFFLSRDLPVKQSLTTIASSGIIKMVAEKNNIQYHETAVGFKYFTPFLKESAQSNTLSLAVESSGGFSLSFHTLEKCGFLPALITLAIIKETGQPLSVLIQKLEKTYATFFFEEHAIDFPKSAYTTVRSALLSVDQAILSEHFDMTEVSSISLNDGIKVTFNNFSWILIRGSGTEPVIRLYSESPLSKEHSTELQVIAKDFLNSLLVSTQTSY